MKTTTVHGFEISALSLGTVQLGLSYGIHNSTGKPDKGQAFAILDRAMTEGITALDTAAGYGDSEEIIGAWRTARGANPFITTKAKHLDHSSLEALRTSLRKEVEASKEHLGLSTLPMLMLHSCDEYNGDEEHMKIVFDELKERGDIVLSGISAYSHHDYRHIAESGFDAVQIPINIFDWKQIDNGGLKALTDAGMMVFVRSVYLQGLVFQDPSSLDPRMEFAKDTLMQFRRFCDRFGMTPAVLALSFALSLPGVLSLVLGSETEAQVAENAHLLGQVRTLSEFELSELHEVFADTDPHVLNPSTWFNA